MTSIISEAGELSWMGSSIQMTTHTQFGGGGGIFGVLKRVAGGGSLFMTEYRALGAASELAFATKLPGHIVPVEVSPGHEYMIHRHGFLCATSQIQISVGFQQSLGAGIFGGDGFLLQKVSGQGTAWLELSGELVVRDLQPGETLRVHPGHVGAFQSSVSFQITTVPGIKNMIFGGDGIFLAALDRPRPHLAADSAHRQISPRPGKIHAPRSSSADRRRRRGRRHRRLHPRQHEVSGWTELSHRAFPHERPKSAMAERAWVRSLPIARLRGNRSLICTSGTSIRHESADTLLVCR